MHQQWSRHAPTVRALHLQTSVRPTPLQLTSPLPLLTTNFRAGGTELRFLSTFATFGASRDVTIDELRIECLFPADDETASRCRSLAENARTS